MSVQHPTALERENLERLSDIASTAAAQLSVAIDTLAPIGSTVVLWWARGKRIEGKVFAPSFRGEIRFESHQGGKHGRHFSALIEVCRRRGGR